MNPNRDPSLREQFVYWLYDENGQCLYVGMTRRPKTRWREHKNINPLMAKQVARCRMAGPYTIGTARRIEREQQELLQPRYDVRQRTKRRSA